MFNIEDVLSSNKLLDGRYRLLRRLNNDSDSVELWMARDITTIDRDAAANDESSGKMVSIMICHPNDALDIEDEQRWQDQFDAAHACRHPNLIPPEEYAVVNDTYYLVFPYSDTETLSSLVGRNLSDRVTKKLVSDLASGLNELHTHQPKIIHNSIRPSNIIVNNDEEFLLSNYGIHFESDSQMLINALNSSLSDSSYVGLLVEDYKSLAKGIRNCIFFLSSIQRTCLPTFLLEQHVLCLHVENGFLLPSFLLMYWQLI